MNSRVGIIVLLAAAACGPNKGRNGNGSGSGGGPDGGGLGWDAPACATSVVKAQKIPLDIYMMLDQSGSMSDSTANGMTKWANVTSAIDTFVQQPNLDGVSVGIQYFGLPPGGGGTCSVATCSTNADCGASACGPCTVGVCLGFLGGGGGTDSCTASDYATASVEIAPLPGVAPQIHQSLGQHSPTTSTPTSAALQGALDHAKAWAQAHASDAVVVVLATDGDPTECDTTISDIAAIAQTAATGMPKILTFVIGVGNSTANLNQIAQGGGTNMAYLVDTGSNVNQQFLDAMNAIRGAALGCQYTIPAPMNGMQPDYNAVNVVFTPGSGGPQTLPYVMSAANCPANGDGWYYDNPQNPTTIILCGSSCTKVEGDPMGEVDVTLGCSTVIL